MPKFVRNVWDDENVLEVTEEAADFYRGGGWKELIEDAVDDVPSTGKQSPSPSPRKRGRKRKSE
jgi:hypothetical protein